MGRDCLEERVRVHVCRGDEDWWQRRDGRDYALTIFVPSASS